MPLYNNFLPKTCLSKTIIKRWISRDTFFEVSVSSRSRNPKVSSRLGLGPLRLESNSRYCSNVGLGVPAKKFVDNGVLQKFL